MTMGEIISENQSNVSQSENDGEFETHSENKNLHETDKDQFHSFFNFMVRNMSYNNTPDENNSLCSNCTDVSEVENSNDSLFCAYSSELLWFGASFMIFFAIFGTTGNFVSILALLKSKRLRNATTAFIVNLCASDMLLCSFTMPFTALNFTDRRWKNGDILCKAFALFKFTNVLVSIFSIVAITVNRYVLIIHPKIYPTLYNKRNTANAILCLWIFPLALLSLPLFNVWGAVGYEPAVGDCIVKDVNGKSPRKLIFVMGMVLPSVLFVACYLRIYIVVKKSIGKIHKREEVRASGNICSIRKNNRTGKYEKTTVYVLLRDKKEFRLLRIALVLFITYIVCTFPIGFLKLLRREDEFHVLNIISYILYFSTSVINPVIYIIMSREYRTAYRELFLSKSR